MAIECSTPRAIVSRWLSSLKGAKEMEEGLDNGVERRRRKKKKDKCGGRKETHIQCSTKCLNEDFVSELNGDCENQKQCRPIIEGAGQLKNNTTFTLGAGFGLAFLIASSKSELNKMMELRAQMESVLQNAKDELQNVEKVNKSSIAQKTTVDYSTTEVEESMNSNGYFSYNDYTPSETLAPAKFHEHDLRHGRGTRQEWSHADRKSMEVELESELKHLQLLCESEGHQDPGQSSTHEGVPPEKLALRLHEVLETRQEERIKELEAAFQQVLQKLDEKEAEASWWKETAQLFSQRLPEVPNPTFRQKSILPAPQISRRSIRLAEKLSSEILMNP
ncbi:hypothetical protein QQ045_018079 [Rhodiola kirilowii]